MNTESQQQIARDAAQEICDHIRVHLGLNNLVGSLHQAAIHDRILSAIERATDGCINTGYKAGVSDVKAIAKSDNSEYYRKCYIKCANDFDDLRQELTAERQKREQVEQELTVVRHRADTSEEAEVAERQRRQEAQADTEKYRANCIYWKETALSALAAIEQAIDILATQDNAGKGRTVQEVSSRNQQAIDQLRNVDLSLLHERDEQLLTAERQRHPSYETVLEALDILTKAYDEVGQSNTLVALAKKAANTKSQLLSALAAIEAMRSICSDVKMAVIALVHERLQPTWKAKFDKILSIDVDLSLLHEREKELQARIETFRKNWPQVHKAIRSDIMLGEAGVEITALVKLYDEISI